MRTLLRCGLLGLTSSLLLALPTAAQQKQGAWWFFGYGSGLNFNYNPPRFDGSLSIAAPRSATISDAQGRLLFTTNGSAVYDRHQQSMPAPLLDQFLPANLLIAPVPASAALYRVLKIGADFGRPATRQQLQLFTVDMGLRSGLGGVLGSAPVSVVIDSAGYRLSLLQHANNVDQWLLLTDQARGAFITCRATAAGVFEVRRAPIGVRLFTREGVMKSAPNSARVALADSVGVRLFDFNRQTGAVTYRYTVRLPVLAIMDSYRNTLSCAFSTDNTKLYVGQQAMDYTQAPEARIYQFDLSQPDSGAVQLSQLTVSPVINLSGSPGGVQISDMQLGIDGKLYITCSDSALSVIDCPNAVGAACHFRLNAVGLRSTFGALALPALNQTLFVNAGTFQVQASDTVVCVGDTVRLAAYGAGADVFAWTAGGAGAGSSPAAVSAPFVVPPVGVTTYMVTGSSQCATHTGQVRVRVQPLPIVTITGLPTTFCLTDFGVRLTGGQPAGGTFTGRGVDVGGLDYYPLQAGVGVDTVRYTYTAPTGCRATATQVVTITACATGLAGEVAAPGLLLYPNPATGEVSVRAATAGPLVLLDALGRTVRTLALAAGETQRLDLRGLPAGVYVVRAGGSARRLVVE